MRTSQRIQLHYGMGGALGVLFANTRGKTINSHGIESEVWGKKQIARDHLLDERSQN